MVRESPTAIVADLKQEPGGDLAVVGSGTLLASLVREGPVDEFRVRVHPILLGGGRSPFQGPKARRPLRLMGSHPLGSGVLELHYEAARSEEP